MEVVILADPGKVAAAASDAVESLLRRKPDAVLGLATGSSPLPVYDELARRHREQGLSFARVRAFGLDEYVGLAPAHPQSYAEVLRREFSARLDIDPAAVQVPDGTAADLPAACRDFEAALRGSGGVDLQLLGVGPGRVGKAEAARRQSRRRRRGRDRDVERDHRGGPPDSSIGAL